MVVEGRMRFNVATRLTKQETQDLVNDFQRRLEEITKHCLDKIENKGEENTPSDFDVKISQGLLDKILRTSNE